MTSVEIGMLSTLVLTIIGVITSLIVLYDKVRVAIKKIIIVDENGNKKVNTFAILRVVMSAVASAEKSGLAGAEKKAIAIQATQTALTEMGIDFDVQEIGDSIDTIVSIINAFIKKK